MIELTEKDWIVGRGFSSGRIREGTFAGEYNKNNISIYLDGNKNTSKNILQQEKVFIRAKFAVLYNNFIKEKIT